jgi:hypothetical protein
MTVFQSGAELGSLPCYLGVRRFRLKMARDRGPDKRICDFGILNWPSSAVCFGPPT